MVKSLLSSIFGVFLSSFRVRFQKGPTFGVLLFLVSFIAERGQIDFRSFVGLVLVLESVVGPVEKRIHVRFVFGRPRGQALRS